jgi:hypothetical protein
MRFALAAWVLLLALVPYLHKPFVHSAPIADLAWVICTSDGAHEVPPPGSDGGACPVLGLLQAFGTELVPRTFPIASPAAFAEVDFDLPLAWRIPDAPTARTPLQPRAPPFA